MSAPPLPRRLFAAAERWFFADAPIEPVAACRIGLGLTLFAWYLIAAPTHDLVWGPDGIMRHAHDPSAPDGRQVFAGALLAAALVGAAGIALGLLTRLSCLVFAFAHLCHTTQATWFTWGWAMVTPVLVAYLALSDAHRMWSLDALIRRRRHPDDAPPRTTPAWPMRLLQVNAIAIYLAAAWHRLDDRGWRGGEMVFEAIAATPFSRAPGLDVHLMPWHGVLEVVCHLTWIIELAAPILLWFRRTRPVMALLLIAVHLGLEVSAFVGAWQCMMISVLCACLPARWLRAVAGAPRRLWSRLSPPRRARRRGDALR